VGARIALRDGQAARDCIRGWAVRNLAGWLLGAMAVAALLLLVWVICRG
jgi:hypothetical protein